MKKRERLRSTREAARLSQAALAREVGTSQQQIQRLEAGHTVRLELAIQISAVLKTDLATLFPEIRDVAKEVRSRVVSDDEVASKLKSKGVDPDPLTWTFVLHMRSGTRRNYVVSSMDADRISSLLQDNNPTSVSFDSEDAEIYVNLEHALCARLLWDGPSERPLSEVDPPHMKVWFRDGEPMTFDLAEEVDHDASDDEAGEIRGLLFALDAFGPETIGAFVAFPDGDGEHVFLRVADIEVLEVTHSTFVPPEAE